MSEQTTAPQDSVLRRHYESALLHADDTTDQSLGPPEDSVLRRHYDSAQALQAEAAVASTAIDSSEPLIDSATPDERVTATEPSPPPANNRAGPSTRPPAHARVPAKPAAPAGTGLMSALRRLLGGP